MYLNEKCHASRAADLEYNCLPICKFLNGAKIQIIFESYKKKGRNFFILP